MTAPRLVTARQLRDVAGALAAGRAIAVPGDGGYQLAILRSRPEGVAILRQRGHGIPEGGLQVVVGRRSQATELTPQWSKATSHVTDRMWPGPLTVMVQACPDEPATSPSPRGDSVVHLTMPAWRPLRALCRLSGPLVVVPLRGADGEPLVTAEEVRTHLADGDIAFVVDGGVHHGPGSTVVDCTRTPPEVTWVGALPESYVEAALLMGGRRRGWFTRRRDTGPE
jgi:L-threonylcarbamoyladenylate synthase